MSKFPEKNPNYGISESPKLPNTFSPGDFLTLKFMKKSVRTLCNHSLASNRRLINLKKIEKRPPNLNILINGGERSF